VPVGVPVLCISTVDTLRLAVPEFVSVVVLVGQDTPQFMVWLPNKTGFGLYEVSGVGELDVVKDRIPPVVVVIGVAPPPDVLLNETVPGVDRFT